MDIVRNNLGGLSEQNVASIKRAQQSDLLTLPINVTGTNCYNCRYIKRKTNYHAWCSNEKVSQYVNHRMCCALWDNEGAYRPYSKTIQGKDNESIMEI